LNDALQKTTHALASSKAPLNKKQQEENEALLRVRILILYPSKDSHNCRRGRHGRHRMVVGFTTYLCNQCLSPLTLWVQTLFMVRCTRYNIMG